MRFCLLAVVALSLCSASVGAESVVVGSSDGKTATTIALHNASPSSVMWSLKLFSFDDLESGSTGMWSATKQTPGASETPASAAAVMPGMEMIVPCDRDNILIAYGTRDAIQKLKESVSALDVPQKQVRVKAQFITVPTADVGSAGLDQALGEDSDAAVSRIRELLNSGKAESINSPVLSVINNVPGLVSVDSSQRITRLGAMPRINDDGTLTLTIRASLKETAGDRMQSLFTERRLADGETVAVGAFVYDDGTPKELVVLLTAEVID